MLYGYDLLSSDEHKRFGGGNQSVSLHIMQVYGTSQDGASKTTQSENVGNLRSMTRHAGKKIVG